MKYMKWVIVALLFVAVTIATSFYIKSLNEEYILDITDVNAIGALNDEYLYFGRPTCPACELFLPLLEEVASEENVKIYYFNTDYFRNNNLVLEDELQNVFKSYQVEQVPLLIELENGKVVGSLNVDFNEEESAKIKENIRAFINYDEWPVEYIPHYTMIIIMFAVSVIGLLLLLLNIKLKSKKIAFVIACTNLSITAVVIFSIFWIMSYLNNKNLSIDLKILALMVAIIVLNAASLLKILRVCKYNQNVDVSMDTDN